MRGNKVFVMGSETRSAARGLWHLCIGSRSVPRGIDSSTGGSDPEGSDPPRPRLTDPPRPRLTRRPSGVPRPPRRARLRSRHVRPRPRRRDCQGSLPCQCSTRQERVLGCVPLARPRWRLGPPSPIRGPRSSPTAASGGGPHPRTRATRRGTSGMGDAYIPRRIPEGIPRTWSDAAF